MIFTDILKIGAFIQENRKKLSISQRALGELMSVTDKAVSKWERGAACPDADNLKNMALLFNCSMSEIINGERQDARYSSNLPTQSVSFDPNAEDYSCDVEIAFRPDTGACISPFLFGDNLEHTRDCVNGGISAQMLKNRKFVGKPQRYGCAMEWYVIGDKTYVTFTEPYTRHFEGYKMKRAHECNSQRITNYFEGVKAGIGQEKICLKAGEEYEFRLIAKAFSKTEVSVALTGNDGQVYDEKKAAVLDGGFEEISLVLVSPVSDKKAHLQITFTDETTLTIGAVSLMPVNNFRGMRTDVIEKMKEIGIKLLRWPGGNFAGEYNWKDGLLPRDQRAPFQSYLWIETQPHTMGYDFHEINVDDFAALCREIGAEPFITINPTWNTPEESAQWVEYCNGDKTTPYGSMRAARGQEEPYHVQFWSLGNEFGYGHMEGANTPCDYARIVSAHAEEMLKVSPELTLCSSGPYPSEEWANHSAKVLKKVAPVVSLHHYAQYPEYRDKNTRKQEYLEFIGKVNTEFLHKLRTLRAQLQDDRIKISYDEWNAWYAWYRGGSVSEGILAASFMNTLFMNADPCGVSMACHFESVNEGALQVHPDRVALSPTGQVFSIMKHHAGGSVYALEKDVIATKKAEILTVTLINRSFDENKTFTFEKTGKISEAYLYSSWDVVPHTVFEKSELTFEEHEKTYKITLPAHSIASVHIKLSDAE